MHVGPGGATIARVGPRRDPKLRTWEGRAGPRTLAGGPPCQTREGECECDPRANLYATGGTG
jgi:hypothetical protein